MFPLVRWSHGDHVCGRLHRILELAPAIELDELEESPGLAGSVVGPDSGFFSDKLHFEGLARASIDPAALPHPPDFLSAGEDDPANVLGAGGEGGLEVVKV